MIAGDRKTITVLLELTRTLATELSLDEALSAVTEAALSLLPGDHASIRVFDESRTQLLASARSGQGTEQPPMGLARGEGLIGWVVEHAVAVRVDDVAHEPRFKPAGDQGFTIRSILAVPLSSGGEVVGVLGVTSSLPASFCDDDEMMGMLLANCAAPAIDRARLRHLAITDPHTRAFSRRYLLPRLRDEVRRARRYRVPLSLALIDVDDFKSVNDTYGHAVGDAVLASFAERVRSCVRDADVLVRRGGDEFVLIMPHTDIAHAHAVAERVRAEVARGELDGGSTAISRTASVGVATWRDKETAEHLEERTDRAMYEAKRAGRNRVVLAT